MHYTVVGLFFCAARVLAAPANTDVVPLEKQQPTVIPIVSQSDELESNGTYKFSYETANGIKREETSYNKVLPKTRSMDSNEGGENDESDEIHVQIGSYSYTAPDGTLISVRYIADENGFQPIGDHIPRVPALGTSSSTEEKSGRALNVADNAGSGSAPAASKSAEKPEAPEELPQPERSGNQKSTPVSVDARSAAVSTTEAKASEASAEALTTEATKTTEAAADVSTTEAVEATEVTESGKTTEAADASTTEASKTTETLEASSTEAPEASSTEVTKTAKDDDALTTESAKVTTEAEASSTETVKTTEAIKATEAAEGITQGADVSTTEATTIAGATV